MATDLHTAANRLLKAWDLNDLIHEHIEALRQALANEALDKMAENARELGLDYEPAQPKYRRGNRLICLETDEYCVIHISGTDRQWIKFPDSYIGVYTNEQVAELFELLPKEPEPWEKFCDSNCVWTDHHPDCKLAEQEQFEIDWPEYNSFAMGCGLEDRGITSRYEAMQYGWDEAIERVAECLPEALYTTPPQRKPLTGEQKDVERYRWLRNPTSDVSLVLDKRTKWVPPDDAVPGVGGYWEYEYRAGEELDMEIDRAIEAKLKEKNNG